jgi:hypothetical protein
MPSPFPGMDPYLEPHWRDVHTSLISGARDMLNQRLPEDLIASAEERVAVESEEGEERRFAPDVRVFELPATEAAAVEGSAIAAPFRLLAQIEPITERFIKIIEVGSERLITVIEVISPTKKERDGMAAFRSKRAELLAAGVNFVEIDLVRSGNWQALLRPHRCVRKAMSEYRVTLRLPSDPAAVHLHPISLRDRLPEIKIPLREQDPPVLIDLQELVNNAYANGRYARRLDYLKPLDPPLTGEDAAWAEELLRKASKR